MKKKYKILLFVVIIIGLVCICTPVFAVNCKDTILGSTSKTELIPGSTNHYPAYYLKVVLTVIKYVGILACVALSTVDFARVIVTDSKDEYKKTIQKSIKRLLFAAGIFFLPEVVELLMELLGFATTGACGL